MTAFDLVFENKVVDDSTRLETEDYSYYSLMPDNRYLLFSSSANFRIGVYESLRLIVRNARQVTGFARDPMYIPFEN